jgi:sigma-B regulation protein RsbU (phosphoserine phosphatase)
MGQGIAGTVAQEGRPLLLEDAYTHPKFHRAHDEATGYRTKSMITVPLKVGERITGVAQVINRLDGNHFDQDDLDLFIALCSLAAIAIENAKMRKSLMEKQRLVKDMEFARTVRKVSPQRTPEIEHYVFSAYYTPAQEIGGDFYDFPTRSFCRNRDRRRVGKGARCPLYGRNWGAIFGRSRSSRRVRRQRWRS